MMDEMWLKQRCRIYKNAHFMDNINLIVSKSSFVGAHKVVRVCYRAVSPHADRMTQSLRESAGNSSICLIPTRF